MMDAVARKNTGSYYTCNPVADYISRWAISKPDLCVLEPSFGDGIFINSSVSRFMELGNNNPNIIGVEIQAEPYEAFLKNHMSILGYQMDFMDYAIKADIGAVIGNPPYISLKNLDKDSKEKALRLVHSYGVDMSASGSLWMPFIIHATELLEYRGKLGFVLPYEITYVRYAFGLWKYLSNNYGRITICRLYHDFFPDVDVETVILLAEEKGDTTDKVCYKIFDTIADLLNDTACLETQISISDILNMDKPFERELMPKSVKQYLDYLREAKKLSVLVQDCKFKIGYVSGNKGYFHLSLDNIRRFSIKPENTRKCLINSKQITSNIDMGIETGSISNYGHLFYPITIGDGEQSYIEYGERQGVDKGYKCQVRKPWYLTPGLEIPDVILTVFGDIPKLLMNNGEFYVSNSLLSGFAKQKNAKELICRWYNSLTLLSVEKAIHSLGGGTLVLIPGETDKLEIISDFPADKIEFIYEKLVCFARQNSTRKIYEYGDDIVLRNLYEFSDETINEIRNAISILRSWRNPEKRRG